jgi:hypothetical protein
MADWEMLKRDATEAISKAKIDLSKFMTSPEGKGYTAAVKEHKRLEEERDAGRLRGHRTSALREASHRSRSCLGAGIDLGSDGPRDRRAPPRSPAPSGGAMRKKAKRDVPAFRTYMVRMLHVAVVEVELRARSADAAKIGARAALIRDPEIKVDVERRTTLEEHTVYLNMAGPLS